MKRKTPLVMWALWNFDTLQDVGYYRRTVRNTANNMMTGGKPVADEMFRTGAFRIGKVAIREIRSP